MQIIPGGLDRVAFKGGAWICPVLDGLAIRGLDGDGLGMIDAAPVRLGERLIADPLSASIGRDANLLQGIGPTFSGPKHSGDRHIAFDRPGRFPACDTVSVEDKVLQFAHIHCPPIAH